MKNPKLRRYITELQTQLTLLTAFLDKYDFSADERAFANVHSESSTIYLHDAALAGDVFGKDGWTRDRPYGATHYNWIRTIDSINLTIYEAERIETQDKTPVPPRIFPLALKDTVDADADDEPFF